MGGSGQCEGLILKQREEKQIQLVRGESLQTGEMEWHREVESPERVMETSSRRTERAMGIPNIACLADEYGYF